MKEIDDSLLNFAPDAMIVVNREGIIIIVNNETEKLFGYQRNELIGKELEILLPVNMVEKHKKHRDSYFRSPKVREMGAGLELSGKKKDGTEFPVEISLSPYETGEGIVAISAIRDITERKQVEKERAKSQKRIEKLLNFIPDAIVTVNKEGTIIFVNHQTSKIFGYEKEELIGKNLSCLIPDRFKNVHKSQVSSFWKSPKVREMGAGLELFGKRKDGTEFPTEISLNPLETDDGTVVISTIRDTTSRKKAEKMILDRTNQLEAVNKELESFSYTVSHDLRAPARHISGFLDILQKNIGSTLDEQNLRYFNLIKESAIEMGQLIDELLSFSRTAKADVSKTVISLNNLVKEIIDKMGYNNNGSKVKWIIENLPDIRADQSLLRIVLNNLISNSVKFTSQKKEPVIQIGSEIKDGFNVIYIKDNGVGFDMKYYDKLFGVFQRLHSIEDFPGTGIGLATAQKIISKHSGKLWAEGIEGEGASFFFSLPV